MKFINRTQSILIISPLRRIQPKEVIEIEPSQITQDIQVHIDRGFLVAVDSFKEDFVENKAAQNTTNTKNTTEETKANNGNSTLELVSSVLLGDKAIDEGFSEKELVADIASSLGVLDLSKAQEVKEAETDPDDVFKDTFNKDDIESLNTPLTNIENTGIGNTATESVTSGMFVPKSKVVSDEVKRVSEKVEDEIEYISRQMNNIVKEMDKEKALLEDPVLSGFLSQSLAKQKYDILRSNDVEFLKKVLSVAEDLSLKEVITQRLSELRSMQNEK
jgi:hypothetical protein